MVRCRVLFNYYKTITFFLFLEENCKRGGKVILELIPDILYDSKLSLSDSADSGNENYIFLFFNYILLTEKLFCTTNERRIKIVPKPCPALIVARKDSPQSPVISMMEVRTWSEGRDIGTQFRLAEYRGQR